MKEDFQHIIDRRRTNATDISFCKNPRVNNVLSV